jgi:protein TonB
VDRPPGTARGEPREGPGSPDRPAFGEYVVVEELPEVLNTVPPAYPAEAREARAEGTVQLQALVLKDGSVGDVRVTQSVPLLDAAAMACVRQWRFKPALSKGAPVAVWVAVPVRFTLH